jgi:hypothetical protein
LRGLYHFLRRIILNRINWTLSIPNNIKGHFLLREEDLSVLLEFFNQNELQRAKLLNIADQFCADKVNIFGKEVNLNDFTIDKFDKNINEDDYLKDLRFSWELYRSKYVFLVGLSYWITGDERYCKALTRFLRRWKDFSLLSSSGIPYNGMEAALKVINLSWCEFFLKKSKSYSIGDQKILIELLIHHTDYIYKNYDISIYGLESNHSLSCSIGLLYASFLFPDYEASDKWRRFGMRTLKRALKKQYSIDGVNFESSVHYHRYTFEILIFLLGIFYRNNFHSEQSIEESIRRIGMALNSLTHKNGYISRFGDNDGGKFLYDLGTIQEFNSLRYLEYFTEGKTPDYMESLLFSSINELNSFLKGGQNRIRIGNYIAYKGKDYSLIVSANEIGTNGKGNHQHNDFLGFELYSNCPFIVDPWSYCYTGNKDLRNHDRKTSTHNSVIIDQQEIVKYDENKLFEMLGNVKVRICEVKECVQTLSVILSHNGYKNLQRGKQIHTRKFDINKKYNTIKISDKLIGLGIHTAGINFHIPKDYWTLKNNGSNLLFYNNQEEFILSWDGIIPSVGSGKISENFLNQSSSYHISITKKYTDNLVIETFLQYNKF